MLGVAVGSVSKWVDQGLIRAGKTPGGHRRIEKEDLIEFLRRQNLRIPRELLDGSPRILLVDDEPSVTRWIAQEIALAHPDWEVLEAHDGFTAGQIVGSQRPDVVVLDLRMPGLDGFAVCRRIKSSQAGRNVAVIAITAQPSADAGEAILRWGARACLAMPLVSRELLMVVADALGRKAAVVGRAARV